MNFFEREELAAESALKALAALPAVATAVKNRAAIKELTDLIATASDSHGG